jgi:predicted  nucleic acid-binding Zn-ribbon protein
MRRTPHKGNIRPKISTMPRQQSEAAALLDVYKLVVEKKRLQQELKSLEERQQQICTRIAIIDQRTAELEATVQKLREQVIEPTSTAIVAPQPTSASGFETILLEY